MEKLIAFAAYKVEGFLMYLHMRGQNLVSYHEVRAMFGGCYPDDVWDAVLRIDKDVTRADIIAELRDIASRNARGGFSL